MEEKVVPHFGEIVSRVTSKPFTDFDSLELSMRGKVKILHVDDWIFQELKEGGVGEIVKYTAKHVCGLPIGDGGTEMGGRP